MNNIQEKQPLPWFKLGKDVTGLTTASAVVEVADLDYEVKKGVAAFVTDGEYGEPGYKIARAFNYNFLYRELGTPDDVVYAQFGPVKDAYTVVQNDEVLEICNELVSDGIADYDHAGCYDNGGNVFVIMRVNRKHDFHIAQDEYANYLMVTFTHNGSGAIVFKYIGVRFGCHNQLPSILYSKAGRVSMKHTANVRTRLAQVPKIMKMLTAGIKTNIAFLQDLYETEIDNVEEQELLFRIMTTPAEWKAWFIDSLNVEPEAAAMDDVYLQRAFLFKKYAPEPRKQMATAIWHYTRKGIGQEGLDKTLYRFLQGATSYFYNEYRYEDAKSKFKALYASGAAKNYIERIFKVVKAHAGRK